MANRKMIVFGLLVVLCASTRAQPAQHVVLISIDGMRPEFYLDNRWPAPNLQQMASKGVYALKMKSVFPSFTYPAHASMVTGAYPSGHAVCFNAPFEPLGSTGHWNWETNTIHVTDLWDAAKIAKVSTAMIEWPVSVGASVTWNIPEIWPVQDGEDRISESRKYSTPGLLEEIERNATGLLTKDNMNAGYLGLDENAGRMAAYILRRYRPGLLAVHFAAVDGAEHEEGRDGAKVRLALAAADHAIGEVLEAIERSGLKDSTALIIVGDHGFIDIHGVLCPNIWLSDQGLLHAGAEWRVKFQPAGGSAFLYLQKAADTVATQDVLSFLHKLPPAYTKLFRVIEKHELVRMGADRNAVLALAAVPGIVFGASSSGMILRPAAGGHHGYDPNLPEMMTGFIAIGAGINKNIVIPQLEVVDIAPLVAALLGIPFEAPDGVLLPGILKSIK